MLVLTRKLHETVQIGHEVTVTIVHIARNKVRIGIQAPRQVHVVRGELPRAEIDPRTHALTNGAA